MKWAGHVVRMKAERIQKDLRQINKKVAENEEDHRQDGRIV